MVGFREPERYLASDSVIGKKTKMAKPSIALTESFASKATISEDIPKEYLNRLLKFLERVGISGDVPDHCNTEDFYSNIIGGFVKPLAILRGRVTCLVSVKPAVTVSFPCFSFYLFQSLHFNMFWCVC